MIYVELYHVEYEFKSTILSVHNIPILVIYLLGGFVDFGIEKHMELAFGSTYNTLKLRKIGKEPIG